MYHDSLCTSVLLYCNDTRGITIGSSGQARGSGMPIPFYLTLFHPEKDQLRHSKYEYNIIIFNSVKVHKIQSLDWSSACQVLVVLNSLP